eukprot:TRINITY_DN2009_c0_g2_i8.p1 TRINITY_DN2009_c0_g2~~TRINITY_DN2009_c0_g2_i8.p1  ORF type:complete len:159 (-),score=40.15 TRINITY_DN2009_c0_g2_i8:402-878(-)
MASQVKEFFRGGDETATDQLERAKQSGLADMEQRNVGEAPAGSKVKDFLFSGGNETAAQEIERAKQDASAYVQSGLAYLEQKTPLDASAGVTQAPPTAPAVDFQATSSDVPGNNDAIREAERAAQAAVASGMRLGQEGRKAAEDTAVFVQEGSNAPNH